MKHIIQFTVTKDEGVYTCACRKSNPDVLVMQTAHNGAGDDAAKRRLEYIEWANSVVAGLRGTSPWLEQEFDDAVGRAARSFVPPKADV
jgi:hypothetical protein